jgi:hypothetical protein
MDPSAERQHEEGDISPTLSEEQMEPMSPDPMEVQRRLLETARPSQVVTREDLRTMGWTTAEQPEPTGRRSPKRRASAEEETYGAPPAVGPGVPVFGTFRSPRGRGAS